MSILFLLYDKMVNQALAFNIQGALRIDMEELRYEKGKSGGYTDELLYK